MKYIYLILLLTTALTSTKTHANEVKWESFKSHHRLIVNKDLQEVCVIGYVHNGLSVAYSIKNNVHATRYEDGKEKNTYFMDLVTAKSVIESDLASFEEACYKYLKYLPDKKMIDKLNRYMADSMTEVI